MRAASLIVFTLGILVLPTIGQSILKQQAENQTTPLPYLALASPVLGWEGIAAVEVVPLAAIPAPFAYISPITPSSTGALIVPTSSETQRATPKLTEWKISLMALSAAHTADAATSWNKRELNPLLSSAGGSFGIQTLAIKCAITLGSIGLQSVLLRRHPEMAKMFARLNFIESGMIGATAIHNSFVTNH